MLKHPSASAILQRSRISLATSVPGSKSKMTTTESPVRAPQARTADMPEDLKQQKPQRGPPAMYFPLGYKDAVHQWVSLERHPVFVAL